MSECIIHVRERCLRFSGRVGEQHVSTETLRQLTGVFVSGRSGGSDNVKAAVYLEIQVEHVLGLGLGLGKSYVPTTTSEGRIETPD
ncbi:hypothetical protein VTN77DRAFT_9757 [Rasamsonia byssochlamydoides]|uniref:uncharacterized protein n=1 Tax=Rasamsonia byssochlamydoides TaxID=89139 RepID=UPI0037436EE7